MANEGILAVKATAPKYLKGASDQTIRQRVLLSMLDSRGQLKFNVDGHTESNWLIQVRDPQIRQYGDSARQNFTEHDAYEPLQVDVRGYIGTDKLSHRTGLLNRGKLAIVNHYDEKLKILMRAARRRIGTDIYADGYATGNEQALIGLGSFMKPDGSVDTDDLVAVPSSSAAYGGKSCQLGALGGSWSADLAVADRPSSLISYDWPLGSGSPEYDALTPKMINAGSTRWPSGTAGWKHNCTTIMRRARQWTRSLGGDGSEPMLHLLCSEFYGEYQDYMESKERIILPHKETSDYGFSRTLNFEGAAIVDDFDVPSQKGYGLNIDELMLFTLHDDLFESEGPEWDTMEQAWLFVVRMAGNLRFNPKHHSEYGVYGS